MYLRKANINDAYIILEWRNDPRTRQNSFSKEIIDMETHLKWFNAKLTDENCFIYILMDGEERVGQIRIDKANDVGEISYMIAPDKRNRGYGKTMLKLVDTVIDKRIHALTGLVEVANEPSRKCFIANGYSEFIGGVLHVILKSYENDRRLTIFRRILLHPL